MVVAKGGLVVAKRGLVAANAGLVVANGGRGSGLVMAKGVLVVACLCLKGGS